MGILTARDVGAPRRLSLRIRDTHRGEVDAPTIIAAGTPHPATRRKSFGVSQSRGCEAELRKS